MEIVSLIVQQLHAGVISLLPFAPILLNLVTHVRNLFNAKVGISHIYSSYFVINCYHCLYFLFYYFYCWSPTSHLFVNTVKMSRMSGIAAMTTQDIWLTPLQLIQTEITF